MNSFQNKRKVTQNDLRLLMSAKKRKLTENKKKINSPLAKYLDDGTLFCVVCDSVVRTEAIWTVHVNSKQHRENISQRRLLDEKPSQPELLKKSLDRTAINSPPVKLRSILKNKSEKLGSHDISPLGFKDQSKNMDTPTEMEVDDNVSGSRVPELPEGFFDDPIMDAKARHIEYKNPADEEWERFQKEMIEESMVSAQILDEDQETNAVEREIERIDEHMQLWSKVQVLEEKIENLQKKATEKKILTSTSSLSHKDDDADSSYGSDEEFDEYIDWRSKKAFK